MTPNEQKPRFDDTPDATREFRRSLFEKVDDLHDIMLDFAGQCKGRHEGLGKQLEVNEREHIELRQGRRENAQAVVEVKATVAEDKKIAGGIMKALGGNKGVILAVIAAFLGNGVWSHIERKENMGKLDETATKAAQVAAVSVSDKKVHDVTLDRDNTEIIAMLKALNVKLTQHLEEQAPKALLTPQSIRKVEPMIATQNPDNAKETKQ